MCTGYFLISAMANTGSLKELQYTGECTINQCHLPNELFLPMLGLGMPPLPMLGGLVLFPENRLCVGDVGVRRGSAVLGLAERFNGCVDPSSC